MKRRLVMILSLALLAGVFFTWPAPAESAPLPMPHPNEGADVVAVFAKSHAQPISMPASPEGEAAGIMADTVWIYYSDNTFEQFAETPLGYEQFSAGTYSLKDGGDFTVGEGEDNSVIVIERDRKLSPDSRMLAEYASSHEYVLGTLGFEQLYGPEDAGKAVEAIFCDEYFLSYTDDAASLPCWIPS